MKYELPQEPPAGSKLLCTSRGGTKYVYTSRIAPKSLWSGRGQHNRYLMGNDSFAYTCGLTWNQLLNNYETVEDYVDEDEAFRKELASIICGFSVKILNPENQQLIDEGMKIVIEKVRDYDAKKGESK